MSETEDMNVAKGIVLGIGTVGAVLLSWFTIMTLWGWFIVPLGLPSINLWHAAGMGLFFVYFSWSTNENDLDRDPMYYLIRAYVKYGVVLFFGWLFQMGV